MRATERVHCFACGNAMALAAGDFVPMCPGCRSAGPHLEPGARRWTVRTAATGEQGPLGKSALVERLLRGALSPWDEACREGAPWLSLAEHPDFRGCFTPGASDWAAFESARTEKAREAARVRRGAALRTMRTAAVVLVGLGAPAYTAWSGFGTLPEPALGWLEGPWGWTLMTAGQDDPFAGLVRAPPATRKTEATLPGEEVVLRLRAAWPDVKEPFDLLVARGGSRMWEGTERATRDARQDLEQAVALAPGDVEAVGRLAEVYATLGDPAQAGAMQALGARAELLDPDSIAGMRAQAAAYLASGDTDRSTELAARCLAASSAAGGEPDVGCALTDARARKDDAALAALAEKHPDVTPVALRLARSAIDRADWAGARRVAERLADRHPDDPEAWSLLGRVFAAVGDWDPALQSLARAAALDASRLDDRRTHASIRLRVEGNPRAARAELEALAAEPGFASYERKARALSDLAAACRLAGDPKVGLQRADEALAATSGDPGASLEKALALVRLDRGPEAMVALRSVDASKVVGRDGARFHLGAARVYLALDRSKEASDELDEAIEADPGWPWPYLESARARLGMSDVAGAIAAVRRVPMIDATGALTRSPLADPWAPHPDWDALRRTLKEAMESDAQLQVESPVVLGVAAWAAGSGEAWGLLGRAPDGDATARAALGWLCFERRMWPTALGHFDAVLGREQNNGLFHALRGRTLAAMGKPEEARTAFGLAMQYASDQPGPHRWRAEAASLAGDSVEARKELEKVVQIDPEDLLARRALLDLGLVAAAAPSSPSPAPE